MTEKHYLENELEHLVSSDISMWHFLQKGSLDGIWYWDLENPENEYMSPQFWEVLGHDPATKKHDPVEWQDIIFQDDLAIALDNFNKHCEDPTCPYDQVVRYRHKDGSTVWVRCRGIAVRDSNGKPIRMLGAHNDLTAVKEAEEAALMRADLLKIAYEEANASNEELKAFSFGVSHDLKSPINTISMILNEVLQEPDKLTDKQRMLIKSGQDTAKRMRMLVDELSDYTHLIGQSVVKERVDLSQITQQVVEDLKSDICDTNAQLHIEDMPNVHASPVQMRILLQNLVSNAIKYRKKDTSPVIEMKGFDNEMGKMAGFTIKDNGIGIDKSQHETVFGLFKRLHRYDEVPGTGLGLTICKRILINHGGQIELRSASNKGSLFTCQFPVS